jgi:hypothetical protein
VSIARFGWLTLVTCLLQTAMRIYAKTLDGQCFASHMLATIKSFHSTEAQFCDSSHQNPLTLRMLACFCLIYLAHACMHASVYLCSFCVPGL